MPTKNNFTGLKNNFVAKDLQYSNLANKKWNKYLETKHSAYREAAIYYVSSAISANPTAKYFQQLASYYDGHSTILALSNYLTAKAYGSNILNKEQENSVLQLKKEAESEIETAIKSNDKEFLHAFLNAGLDNVIRINNQSILNYSISLDQPDAVQLILNKQVEGKTQNEVQSDLQKVIMLCAVYNSPNTIQRLIDLGVNIDFTLDKTTPVFVADKAQSIDALNVLLENTIEKSKYKEIENKSVYIQKKKFLELCRNKDYVSANNFFNQIPNPVTKDDFKLSVIELFYQYPEHITVLKYMEAYCSDIKSSVRLKDSYENLFLFHLLFNLNNKIDVLLTENLIDIDNIKIDETRISEVHKIGYNLLRSASGVDQRIIDSSYQTSGGAASEEKFSKALNNLENNLEYGDDSFSSSLGDLTSLIENMDYNKNPQTISGGVSYFDWQSIYLVNQVYPYFWFDGINAGKLAPSFAQGGALWDEKIESAKDLYDAVSSFVSKNPWEISEKQLTSLRSFLAKLNTASISTNARLGREDYYTGYRYYTDTEENRDMMNSDPDFPSRIHEFIQQSSPKSVVQLAILKRDNHLIETLNSHFSINWNEEVNGSPLFVQLAKTLNWEMLNLVISTNQVDLNKTDDKRNTIFHYLADYYWQVFYKTQKVRDYASPDMILPELYASSFDRQILSKTNNLGQTALDIFKDNRRVYTSNIYIKLGWSRSFEKKITPYLKK